MERWNYPRIQADSDLEGIESEVKSHRVKRMFLCRLTDELLTTLTLKQFETSICIVTYDVHCKAEQKDMYDHAVMYLVII